MSQRIKEEYRRYDYCDNVPFISKDTQWLNYFDTKFDAIDIDTDEIKEVIETTINNTIDVKLEVVNNNIEEAKIDVNTNIDEAKQEINENVDNSKQEIIEKIVSVGNEIGDEIEQAKDHLCCDICCSKNEIIEHIDNKIGSVNFEEQFSNLNEQVAEILRKLDE